MFNSIIIPRIRFFQRRKAGNRSDYLSRKEIARLFVTARLDHYLHEYEKLNPLFKNEMKFTRISIRNQSSRWGSCSSKKNLNFNYKILDLSPELQDYIIVHELCHLIELNHGKSFWNLVELLIPRAREYHYHFRRN